jgi:hypothetical protein
MLPHEGCEPQTNFGRGYPITGTIRQNRPIARTSNPRELVQVSECLVYPRLFPSEWSGLETGVAIPLTSRTW